MLVRQWLFRFLALSFGGMLALGTLEFLVRATGLDTTELQITMGPETAAFARFDPEKGWVNLAGQNGNNKQGFRFPRDYTRRSNAEHRIILLGDSQVWGTGVEPDEHLGVLLDRQIGEAEVYPFGVPGYGPTQELLVLEDVLRDYDVDEIFVVAFVYNDLVNASVSIDYGGFQKPFLRETRDGWALENRAVPRPILETNKKSRIDFFRRAPEMEFLAPNQQLIERSAIFRTLVGQSSRQRWLAVGLAKLGLAEIITEIATANEQYSIRRIDGQNIPCWHLEHCPEEHSLDGLRAVTAAYLEMQSRCQKLGIELSVVLTPSYPELEHGRSNVIDALARSLEIAGISVVDVREPFRSEKIWKKIMGPTRHWTAHGHRLVANAIEKDWRERLTH